MDRSVGAMLAGAGMAGRTALRVLVCVLIGAALPLAPPGVALAAESAPASPAPGASPADPAGPSPQPVSILLITIDALRADHLPAYGYPRSTTPFLQSLSRASSQFVSAYSTSSWTVPALVSTLTGLHPPTHGVVRGVVRKDGIALQEEIPRHLPVVTEGLRERGYRCFAAVSNPHLMRQFGFARGFHRFRCLGVDPAAQVNEALLDWKEEIEGQDGPIFVWLHYFDPHLPYEAREPWFTSFQPDATEEEEKVLEAAERVWPYLPPQITNDLDRYRLLLASRYDSEIRAVDREIERLFRQIPRFRRCVLIVSSDHGEELFDHGQVGHGNNLYGESLRVPLLVRVPGKPGGMTTEPATLVDLYPTLLALGGAPPRAGGHGRVLRINGSTGSPLMSDRPILGHLSRSSGAAMATLIQEPWKIIYNASTDRVELYDLREDGGESRDLDDVHPRRSVELRRALARELAALEEAAPSEPPERLEISQEQKERLLGLGYIE